MTRAALNLIRIGEPRCYPERRLYIARRRDAGANPALLGADVSRAIARIPFYRVKNTRELKGS